MTEIEKLHEELFGFVPDKGGVAYERLAALALAVIGWQAVVHDVRETGEGRRTAHQLDVVAERPDGAHQRLIVECKSGAIAVGKEDLDKLVGVRHQLNADAAAVMSVAGYKQGALDVAADEHIALIVLRPFRDPEDWEGFVKSVHLQIRMYGSTISAVRPVVTDTAALERLLGDNERLQVTFDTDDRLVRADGNEAETLREILEPHTAGLEEGVFEREAVLPPDRHLRLPNGELLPVSALRWTETSSYVETDIVTEGRGRPVLLLEQLQDDGTARTRKLLVDADLNAWHFDANRNVIQRRTSGLG